MDDCIIQVTQWQKNESLLEKWIGYLSMKGYSLKVKKKLNGEGRMVYGLFRNLNNEEIEEIKAKKYAIVRNSLERRMPNGRRVK